ncbi:glycosyltransferase family 2 protein [Kaistella sp.]|uniref:glycosyltransferase family 2 protein n=1 Tax=Kaistella sp. TaxID=2782235 RepID=UPI003C36AA7E
MQEIAILLATYNGEKYLRQQLDSLIAQSFSGWKLYIRDDGSTDHTVSIIKEYCNLDQRFFFIEDAQQNKGARDSFFSLLESVDSSYYMFCDQDDIWLDTKVEQCYNEIKKAESLHKDFPVLVATDAKVVDSDLKIINPSFWNYTKVNPERLIKNCYLQVFNFAPGCTMMFNHSLKKLVKPIPKNILMHDWWLLILAERYGVIKIINRPLILYRQHSSNTLGAHQVDENYFLGKLKNLRNVIASQQQHLQFLKEINGLSKLNYYQIKLFYNLTRLK